MKRLLLYVITCCMVTGAGAQILSKKTFDYSLSWYRGRVIFPSGDTVACKVRYNQMILSGALQITDNQHIITLSPKEVRSFSFYDEKRNRVRKFSTMPVLGEELPCKKVFLEYIYDDNQFSILNHKTVDVPYDYMNYSRFIGKPVLMNKKYILNRETGELLPLSKNNTLKLLGEHKSEITAFIHENNIKFRRVADFIHVFRYHNTL